MLSSKATHRKTSFAIAAALAAFATHDLSYAQAELTTTASKEGIKGCPGPGGEGKYKLEVEDAAATINPNHRLAGVYIQKVTHEWDLCTGCPDREIVEIDFFGITLYVWVRNWTEENCTKYPYEFYEFREVPHSAVQGGTVNIGTDTFRTVGAGAGKSHVVTATDKTFFGSAHPQIEDILAGLLFGTDSKTVKVAKPGAPGKKIVIDIYREREMGAPLPPHVDFINIGGFQGSRNPGADVLNAIAGAAQDPNAATDEDHGAVLLWDCCPDTDWSFFDVYPQG